MWLHRAKPVVAMVNRQAPLTGKLVKSKPREVQTSRRTLFLNATLFNKAPHQVLSIETVKAM